MRYLGNPGAVEKSVLLVGTYQAHAYADAWGDRDRKKSSVRERERERKRENNVYICIYISILYTGIPYHLYHVGTPGLPPLLWFLSSYWKASFFFHVLYSLGSLLVQSHTIQSDGTSNATTIDCDHHPDRGVALHAGVSKADFFQIGEKCRTLLARKSVEDGSVPFQRD